MKVENNCKELKSIPEKILYLLELAKKGEYSKDDLNTIRLLSTDFSSKIFGYSVSDYAIATLKWLNTDETVSLYNSWMSILTGYDKERVEELVSLEQYKSL